MKILLGILGVITTIFSIFFYGKGIGKDQEQSRQNKKVLEDVEKSKKINDGNSNLTDDELRAKLRGKDLRK